MQTGHNFANRQTDRRTAHWPEGDKRYAFIPRCVHMQMKILLFIRNKLLERGIVRLNWFPLLKTNILIMLRPVFNYVFNNNISYYAVSPQLISNITSHQVCFSLVSCKKTYEISCDLTYSSCLLDWWFMSCCFMFSNILCMYNTMSCHLQISTSCWIPWTCANIVQMYTLLSQTYGY